ncbi:NTP pyrophosphatase (non-canonical NTP hydrolase) [Kribbella amoyensis]|uniref:NTP pyrophosphatase (Non-canonical NTP hydrolase) n=1 Tax=Kribbella amoyensis TaxID=996641 RepID=A0A561B2S6_9ACTN|nr:nucleotide pyrophosphohydrolase [Kribbella amoyensis]TWD73142.1 NTP pyrophosphatase (non-canonical NTP hydrolase) [Kribbella amoyensis]
MSDLIELRDRMRAFTDERDWAQFHDPKSLLLALVGEVGELAELFQWVPADQAIERAASDPLRRRAAEELADVLAYLVRLADVLDIDLAEVTRAKLADSAQRFPAGDVRGEAPDKAL